MDVAEEQESHCERTWLCMSKRSRPYAKDIEQPWGGRGIPRWTKATDFAEDVMRLR